MKKILTKGFTLIELLVVIAIIGILAAVVLASLNDARDNGSDAAVKQSLGNLRSQAEIIYNKSSFSYASVCSVSGKVGQLLSSASQNSAAVGATPVVAAGTAGTGTTVVCHSQAASWAAAAPLKGASGSYWCVDSTGRAASTSASLAASGATQYACP